VKLRQRDSRGLFRSQRRNAYPARILVSLAIVATSNLSLQSLSTHRYKRAQLDSRYQRRLFGLSVSDTDHMQQCKSH
jgi:hypothetical protein